MGCGGSKAVAIAGSTCTIGGDHSREVSSNSLTANNHADIVVFGPNDVDFPIDPVDNAKPRLVHSAIGRGSKQNCGPITPFLGSQEEKSSKTLFNGFIDSNDKNEDVDVFSLDKHEIRSKSQRSDTRSVGGPMTGHIEDHQELLSCASPMKVDNLSLSGESYSQKTPNDHGDSSQIPRLQVFENKEDLFSCTSRTNISGSRASSAKAGSILTTTNLNTSIVTSYDGDDFHSELALGTPHTSMSMTDQECSTFRTMSITPSIHASVDATPINMHDKSFGTIMEEYEGGFTPRSICNGEGKGYVDSTRKFIPREVFQHNHYIGWREWSIYKGRLYDNKMLKEIFTPLIETDRERKKSEMLEIKMQRKERQDDSDSYDFDDSYSDDFDYSDICKKDDLSSLWTWNTNGVRLILRNGLDKKTVEDSLPPACIGTMANPSDKRYWEDVRSDIKILLDDLNHKDAKDELSTYLAEFLRQLQRWIKKYRELCPDNSATAGGDPNKICFPLPEGIDSNSAMRAWIDTWESFDLEIPENGAWTVIEIEDIDLGDPHEIFAATLKSHVNLTPLDTEIDGEAGWRVIPEGLFADDVMTEEQKITEERRKVRRDLYDEARMRRRRHRLLKYFMDKYDKKKSDIEHFLNWADEMERGEKKFLSLC